MTTGIKRTAILILTFSLLVGARESFAQGEREPLFDQLTNTFKNKYLSIGILLQTVADFQIERSVTGYNGFNISNMRINLYGELDEGFGYLFKTNLIRAPAILDAKLYYEISSGLTVDGGHFKPPFSAEFLIGAGSIDFVNRSQVVSSLAPGRQIGVQAKGRLDKSRLSYATGIFNGNGFARNNNDNNDFMYVGRLVLVPDVFSEHLPSNRFEIGASTAFSHDDDASFGGGFVQNFNGKRFLLGGDFRLVQGGLLLSGEVVYARLEYRTGKKVTPFGYHATLGYMVTDKSQILLRWDSFMPDGLKPDSDLLILGYNLWPTRATELQVNYLIPTREGAMKHHQLLINAQFAF